MAAPTNLSPTRSSETRLLPGTPFPSCGPSRGTAPPLCPGWKGQHRSGFASVAQRPVGSGRAPGPCAQAPCPPSPQHREPGQWAGQRRAGAGGAGGLGGLGTRLGVGVRGGGLEIRRGLGAAETRRRGLRGGRGLGESGEAACAPVPPRLPVPQAAPSPWPRGSCREQVWGF